MPYWASDWSSGFNGNFQGLAGGGDGVSRFNFSNGWFVGSDHGPVGSTTRSFGALGNGSALSYEGVQFGYNMKSAPVTVYAGFDTLKYNSNFGSPFAPFDSVSSTAPGYSAHAGVEFRPTSNLSLSVGASFTQQTGAIDGFALPGASPNFVGRR